MWPTTAHHSLNATSEFNSLSASRTFTIAMTDIGEIYCLPQLMKRLAAEAPGVTISTVRNQADTLREEMERGEVDLAIGFLPDLNTGSFQRRLFRQRYVCVFRKDHSLAKTHLTMKSFVAAEHVSIVDEGIGHGMVDTAIQRAGVQRNVRLRVPHFVAVGHILRTTDLIAVVPEAMPLAHSRRSIFKVRRAPSRSPISRYNRGKHPAPLQWHRPRPPLGHAPA